MLGLFLLEDEDDNVEGVSSKNVLQNKKQDRAKKKEILKDINRPDEFKADVGGLSSYLKRNLPFINEDERIFKQIHSALQKVKTEGDKVALLKKIDDVMANTSGSGNITWKDVAVSAGIWVVGGGINPLTSLGLHGMLIYNIGKWLWGKSSNRQEFLDRMRSVRAAVEKYPVSKNTETKSPTAYVR